MPPKFDAEAEIGKQIKKAKLILEFKENSYDKIKEVDLTLEWYESCVNSP